MKPDAEPIELEGEPDDATAPADVEPGFGVRRVPGMNLSSSLDGAPTVAAPGRLPPRHPPDARPLDVIPLSVSASDITVGADPVQPAVLGGSVDLYAPAGSAGFDDFYRTARPKIARALALALGDADLAAEATDEAMTRAYERWARV